MFKVKWKERLAYKKGKKDLHKTVWGRDDRGKIASFPKRRQARQFLHNWRTEHGDFDLPKSVKIVHSDGKEEKYIDSIQTEEEKKDELRRLFLKDMK